jgi:hypothetical protein
VLRAVAVSGAEFYPSIPDKWIKRINPFVWVSGAEDRNQMGRKSFICPPCGSTSPARILRVDYGTGHETYAGQKFLIGRASVDGGAQFTRWLNIGGGTQAGPSIFYDPEAPYQGDRRSSNLRIGLQPNALLNSNTSYSFVTFKSRVTGLNVYRGPLLNLRTLPVHPAILRVRSRNSIHRASASGDFLASCGCHQGRSFMQATERCSAGGSMRSTVIQHDARALFQGVLPAALLTAAKAPAFTVAAMRE